MLQTIDINTRIKAKKYIKIANHPNQNGIDQTHANIKKKNITSRGIFNILKIKIGSHINGIRNNFVPIIPKIIPEIKKVRMMKKFLDIFEIF